MLQIINIMEDVEFLFVKSGMILRSSRNGQYFLGILLKQNMDNAHLTGLMLTEIIDRRIVDG